MPNVRSILGLQDSRWGFRPKEASSNESHEGTFSNIENSDEKVSQELSESDVQNLKQDDLSPKPTMDSPLKSDQKNKSDQSITSSKQSTSHKADTSATITEHEWSVIEKASAEFEREQKEKNQDQDGSEVKETAREEKASSLTTQKTSNGGGDQLGAEALLDLGKPNGFQEDELAEIKKEELLGGSLDSSSTQAENSLQAKKDTTISKFDKSTVSSNPVNSADPKNKPASKKSDFIVNRRPPLNQSIEEHTGSDNEEPESAAESEKIRENNTNPSYPSTAALVAAAAAAISSGNPSATSSSLPQPAAHSSSNASSTLDPELQAFLNQDNPNWQRFYTENMSGNVMPGPVDLSMILNENESGESSATGISRIVPNTNPSTNGRPLSKRGRKRKVMSADVSQGHNVHVQQESEVDPSLEQLDMNAAAAAASEIDAARLSKEQSQLEDALLHASAIARDLHSQSPNQHTLYDDSMISDVERALKKRNSHMSDSTHNLDDDSGINNIILNEALQMAGRSKYQSPHDHSSNSEINGNQTNNSSSVQLTHSTDYWEDSSMTTRHNGASSNRASKAAAPTRKMRKRNNTLPDDIPIENVSSSVPRRRYNKRNSTAQQQLAQDPVIPLDVSHHKGIDENGDVSDPSIMDPADWQSAQGSSEHGGSFTTEEINKLDNFMSNYCLENHISRETLCHRVWSNERVKDNFWDRVTDVLPHRARASVYKHIRRAYHVFKSRGKWQDHEEEELKKLFSEKGPQWKIIGQKMGRMPEDCRDRWRNYVKCGENRLRNKWDAEEEEKLREAVAFVISEHPDNEINWTAVSDRMNGTRSRIQCRYKWNKMMKRATIAKIDAMMTQDNLLLIKYLLDNGYEDESQVDWDGFAAMDSRGFWSGSELQMAFERLKPKDTYLSRSFREIVVNLHHELSMDVGQLKNDQLQDSMPEMDRVGGQVSNVTDESALSQNEVIDPVVSDVSSLPMATMELQNDSVAVQSSLRSHGISSSNNEEELNGNQPTGISIASLTDISSDANAQEYQGHNNADDGELHQADSIIVSDHQLSSRKNKYFTSTIGEANEDKSSSRFKDETRFGLSDGQLRNDGSVPQELPQESSTLFDDDDNDQQSAQRLITKQEQGSSNRAATRRQANYKNHHENGSADEEQASERTSPKDSEEDLMAVAAAAMQHSI